MRLIDTSVLIKPKVIDVCRMYQCVHMAFISVVKAEGECIPWIGEDGNGSSLEPNPPVLGIATI
jgi:hypothetical protein